MYDYQISSLESILAAQQEYRQWLLIFAMVWGSISGLIGSKRGGSGFAWFFVGAVLGPFALPLPFLFAGTACPYCRKSINRKARICPYCRSPLEGKERLTDQDLTEIDRGNKTIGLVFGTVAIFVLLWAWFKTR